MRRLRLLHPQPTPTWSSCSCTCGSRDAIRLHALLFDVSRRLQVRGVSFANDLTGEERQGVLQQLQPNDPVLCVREPDNPADDKAVRVCSTHAQLGYVPAELTDRFEHSCAGGYLEWAAANTQVEGALLGASVQAIPGLRAAFTQALPPAVVPWADLSAHLPASKWAAIERGQLERTFGSCQVTGLQSVPLNPEKVRPCAQGVLAEPAPGCRLRTLLHGFLQVLLVGTIVNVITSTMPTVVHERTHLSSTRRIRVMFAE